MTEYVDAREFSPEHTTIPCMECGTEFYVAWSFAMHRDEWYCQGCLPDELRNLTSQNVVVR